MAAGEAAGVAAQERMVARVRVDGGGGGPGKGVTARVRVAAHSRLGGLSQAGRALGEGGRACGAGESAQVSRRRLGWRCMLT